MTKYIIIIGLMFSCGLKVAAQQTNENDYIRRGNRLYADSLYEKAEVEYRKALELNSASTDALYNLGNALFYQAAQTPAKATEALEQYITAAKLETDKERLAQIYHNMGVLYYLAQQYPKSVAAYKESLRNNPADHETRYNLAKAMHMNKQQPQQDQQEQQQQEQQQQNQEEQQQQEQQQEQEQQNKEEEQQQQQNQQQEQQEQISKDNAEQILNALMQDEKEVQEKQKKMIQQQQGKTLDKDW